MIRMMNEPIRPFSVSEIYDLDWRNDKDDVSEQVFLSDFELAFQYAKKHLPHLCQIESQKDHRTGINA
jgi:hypothetical protein